MYFSSMKVNLTKVPNNMEQTSLRIINSVDCPLLVTGEIYPDWNPEKEGSANPWLAPAEVIKDKPNCFIFCVYYLITQSIAPISY